MHGFGHLQHMPSHTFVRLGQVRQLQRLSPCSGVMPSPPMGHRFSILLSPPQFGLHVQRNHSSLIKPRRGSSRCLNGIGIRMRCADLH